MDNGTMVAAVLIALVGIILIFTILKINENLTQINQKLDNTNKLLEDLKKQNKN